MDKIKVIYNGIDPEFVQKINTSISFEKIFQLDTKPYLKIINIADHIEPKNIELIISVLFKLIKKLKVKVLFINVGTGPLTKTYLSKVKEFDISDNVKFLGKVRNEDAITLLKDSDYMLHPSKLVIFDYVILEALACGTTVIANNVGGNREILVDGYNGILINDDNYNFISNVIQNEKKISEFNMHESLNNFSIEKMIQAFQTLYQE